MSSTSVDISVFVWMCCGRCCESEGAFYLPGLALKNSTLKAVRTTNMASMFPHEVELTKSRCPQYEFSEYGMGACFHQGDAV